MTKAHALSTQSRTENLWWLSRAAASIYPLGLRSPRKSTALLSCPSAARRHCHLAG